MLLPNSPPIKPVAGNSGMLVSIKRIVNFTPGLRVISSAGLEHYLDKVGVTGSSPVLPTSYSLKYT
jgi:hypothetical protein